MAITAFESDFGMKVRSGRKSTRSEPDPRQFAERNLVHSLRQAGACSSETATALPGSGQASLIARQLMREGILHTSDNGYWLDEATLGRVMRSRLERKKVLSFLLLIALALIPAAILLVQLF